MKTEKILLTGVSSFTGYWFAKILSETGYELCCPLPKNSKQYSGIKRTRLDSLPSSVRIVYSCPFGSDLFIDLLGVKFDILCHHASFVQNYQNKTFELTEAISQNTKFAEKVLDELASLGCKGMIWTSSVFEDAIQEEINVSSILPAWYRYALSKKLSGVILQNLSRDFSLKFAKFVITNPFGPLEDHKLVHLILEAAKANKDFEVRTPNYIRDMIHVRHLALAYKSLVFDILNNQNCNELRPYEFTGSLYSLADFFMNQVKMRVDTSSRVIDNQTVHTEEPISLTNNQHVSKIINDYDPKICWDEYLMKPK